MDVYLCIPCLNNYSGLYELIVSAESGTLVPTKYYIIDNGNKLPLYIPNELKEKLVVHRPEENIGVAKSWNWFIKNVPEIRIISNDDLILAKDTIEKMVNDSHGLVCGLKENNFSLFKISDEIINVLGYFDEEISPNYAYFEDGDYAYRYKLANLDNYALVETDIKHPGSQTLNNYTQQQRSNHHMKFRRAEHFYNLKWGGKPHEEKFTIPFNGNKELALSQIRKWWEY